MAKELRTMVQDIKPINVSEMWARMKRGAIKAKPLIANAGQKAAQAGKNIENFVKVAKERYRQHKEERKLEKSGMKIWR